MEARKERELQRQTEIARKKTEAILSKRKAYICDKWRTAISRVRENCKTAPAVPLFPIDNLQDFKEFFTHPVTGDLLDLDEPMFIRTFLKVFSGRNRTYRELKQRFSDIDVNVDGTVSWDEFTSFAIHQAASAGTEDTRAKEYIYNPIIGPIQGTEHKDLAQVCLMHERCPEIVTSGFDGLIKFWDKKELLCTDTLDTLPAQGRQVGTTVVVCPVIDMCFNPRGTVLFSAGVDKRVLAFDAITKKLSRGFMGTMSPAAEAMATGNGVGGLNQEYMRGRLPSDVTALRCMDHPVSGFHVGYPDDREIFYFGLQSGEVVAYVSMRHAMLAEVPPLFTVRHHTKAVSKVRYYAGVGIVSCSWDHTLKVMDAATGALTATLGAQRDGHPRAVLDFDFNPTTRLLASVGCDRNVYLWNPYFDSPLAILKGHTALLQRCSFNELDHQLVTLDQENVIKTWDMKTYKEFQTISPGETVHQSAGSAYCKFSTLTIDSETSDMVACGFRPYTWTIRRALSSFPNTHGGHTENVFSVKYIRSTQTIVTNDFNTVMTWDVKTGRRNIVFDPNPILSDNSLLSSLVLDETQRRALIAMKDATLKIFNPRNAQLLKEVQTDDQGQEPVTVVHLTNKDETSKVIAMVFSKKIIFFNDIDEPQDPSEFMSITTPSAITTAVAYPSLNKTTLGSLVVGTIDGQLICYSSTTGLPLSTSENPHRPPTRVHTSSRQGSRGSRNNGRRGRLTSNAHAANLPSTNLDLTENFSLATGSKQSGETSQPIEDIVFLPRVDLFAVVSADSVIHFWDVRRNELKLTFHTNMSPSECLLCLSTESVDNKLLVAGCDMGCIYVRDISKLHSALSMGWVNNPTPPLPLMHVFKAHGGPVTQLQVVAHKFIVTLGVDSYIKMWNLAGENVGYFGQKQHWNLKDPSTFHACTAGDVVVDDRNIPPRSIRPLTRQVSTPVGGAASWGQGRLNSRGVIRDSAEDSAFLTQGPAPVTLTSMSAQTLATGSGPTSLNTSVAQPDLNPVPTMKPPTPLRSGGFLSPTTGAAPNVLRPMEVMMTRKVSPPPALAALPLSPPAPSTPGGPPPLPSFMAAMKGMDSPGKNLNASVNFQSAVSLQPARKAKGPVVSSPLKAPSPSKKKKAVRPALEGVYTALFKHPNEDVDPISTLIIPSFRPSPSPSCNLGAIPTLADPDGGRKMKPLVDREKRRTPGAPLHFTECRSDFNALPLEAHISVPKAGPVRSQSTEPLSVMLKKLEKEARMIKQQSIKEMSIAASASRKNADKNENQNKAKQKKREREEKLRALLPPDPEDELEKRRQALKLPLIKETKLCELHKSTTRQSQFGTSWMSKKQAFLHEAEEMQAKNRVNNPRLQEVQGKLGIDPKTWTQRSASLLMTTKMDAVSTITDTMLKKYSLR